MPHPSHPTPHPSHPTLSPTSVGCTLAKTCLPGIWSYQGGSPSTHELITPDACYAMCTKDHEPKPDCYYSWFSAWDGGDVGTCTTYSSMRPGVVNLLECAEYPVPCFHGPPIPPTHAPTHSPTHLPTHSPVPTLPPTPAAASIIYTQSPAVRDVEILLGILLALSLAIIACLVVGVGIGALVMKARRRRRAAAEKETPSLLESFVGREERTSEMMLQAFDAVDTGNGGGTAEARLTAAFGDLYLAPTSIVVGKKIAAGGYGEVRLGTFSGTPVVLKSTFAHMMRGDATAFIHEARMLANIRHPGVVHFFGVTQVPTKTMFNDGGAEEHEEESFNLFLVMECAERGSLGAAIDAGSYRIRDWHTHAVQLAQTIAWLHKKGIVHRDLKPGNVLVSKEGRVKLCDLGISRKIPAPLMESKAQARDIGPAIPSPAATMTMNIGTAKFMPPEVLCMHSTGSSAAAFVPIAEEPSESPIGTPMDESFLRAREASAMGERRPTQLPRATLSQSRYDGMAWDTFSLSLVYVVMWQRSQLLPEVSPFAFANAVVRGMRPPVPDGVPPPLERLLIRMWAQDSSARPLMDEVVEVLQGDELTSAVRDAIAHIEAEENFT